MKVAASLAKTSLFLSAYNGFAGPDTGGYGFCHSYYSSKIVSKKSKKPQAPAPKVTFLDSFRIVDSILIDLMLI